MKVLPAYPSLYQSNTRCLRNEFGTPASSLPPA